MHNAREIDFYIQRMSAKYVCALKPSDYGNYSIVNYMSKKPIYIMLLNYLLLPMSIIIHHSIVLSVLDFYPFQIKHAYDKDILFFSIFHKMCIL